MAAIIQTFYSSSATLYAHIRDSAGAVWNGSSFESYNASNWANYDVALSEDGTSGYYKVTFPGAISAGKYGLFIYSQTGGSPAEGDRPVGTGSIQFDGTNEYTGLVSDTADGVLDEAMSGHLTIGTLGGYLQAVRSSTAQAGAAGTITLDASASAVDDFYINQVVHIISGTGAGQSKIISDYTGSSKVADVNDNWATNPDNTSVFVIYPFGSVPGASAPTAAANADAVWDEARSGHVAAGSFGEGVLAESLNTQAKADVNAEVDTALADIDLDHLINSSFGSNPAVGSLMDLIMNKDGGQTFAQATDSLEGLKDTGSGPSAGDVAQEVWAHGLDGTDAAGSAGERVKAIDDKLPTGTISDFDETADSVNLNASQSGVTIGTVNALGTTAQGQVNNEVVDVIRVDVISELSGGAPVTTPTVATALMLLYMALRNKRTTSETESKIYNNAGSAITTATVSDSGTEFTKEQFGAP